jgi:hypothetical protein
MQELEGAHTPLYIALFVLGIIILSLLVPLSDGLRLEGFFGEKTYLILLQDNDEIRGTGGLIGVIGLLTLHNGQVAKAEFHYVSTDTNDSTWDPIVPLDGPESFTTFFGVNSARLSDSNVQYDFASFASKMQSEFYNVTGTRVDGIIALDFTAVEAFMRVTGPVLVSGEIITDRNVVDRLHYYSLMGEGAKTSLTSVISTLMFNLARAVRDFSVPQKLALYSTLRSLQDEKHVLTYPNGGFFFYNPSDERPSRTDFISVVDITLGTGKADFGVNRTTDYNVQLLSDGSAVANLTLTYTNNCWWDYDVFSTAVVPAGAELLTAHNVTDNFKGPEVTSGAGFTAFSSRLLVGADSSGSVQYTYKIPSAVQKSVLMQRYELYVDKQAGITRYTLSVNVTVPPGATVVSAENARSNQMLTRNALVKIVYI